jgi:transposase
MKKQDGRKRSPEALYEIRKLIVQNKQQGKTHAEVAQILGVSSGNVEKVMRLFREGGMKNLQLRKRGRPSDTKLGKAQAAQVKKWIEDKTPDQYKLPYGLWTREAVSDLIYSKFKIRVSKWTVGRYLKAWGFTPQKPVYKAYEQNSRQVKEWLDEKYPAIKQRAQSEGSEIFWGDETGMRSDHHAGRSYAPKGKTPVVRSTGNRFKANMISAISNKGVLRFMIYERFNSETFIKFLTRLVERSERKIILIVDGHPAHKTNKVKNWLSEHSDKIEMEYLPGYSPELNPDEYLNQDLKTNALGKQRPRDKGQLIKTVKSFLRAKQRDPEKVRAYFRAKHVLYAA